MFLPPTYKLKRKKKNWRKKVVGKEGGLTGNPALHVWREGLCEIITGLRLPCSSDSGLPFSSDEFKSSCLATFYYLLTHICTHE